MYRLMIVDDEYMIHRSLRKLVESSGLALEVTADAEDGAEALQVLQEQDIDIVVTDIHMPEMNGISFLRKFTHRKFKVVYTTAHVEHAFEAYKNEKLFTFSHSNKENKWNDTC